MTTCKMGRPTEWWATTGEMVYTHKDDVPDQHIDHGPGNMGTRCFGAACTSRAPRTDSERLDAMIQNGWHFEASSQDDVDGWQLWDMAGAVIQSNIDAREAIDAAMGREGESNG